MLDSLVWAFVLVLFITCISLAYKHAPGFEDEGSLFVWPDCIIRLCLATFFGTIIWVVLLFLISMVIGMIQFILNGSPQLK